MILYCSSLLLFSDSQSRVMVVHTKSARMALFLKFKFQIEILTFLKKILYACRCVAKIPLVDTEVGSCVFAIIVRLPDEGDHPHKPQNGNGKEASRGRHGRGEGSR